MSIIRNEQVLNVFGIDARAYNVVAANGDLSGAANPGHIVNQVIKATRYYKECGRDYRITAELRFDDECGNGHESFGVTADIRENGREYSGGCLHDEIAEHFPEWAHLIKWHLTSTNGPMHYVANTLHHAGDRDCWGLRKGERRQIKNGKTGELCWKLEAVNPGPDQTSNTPTGMEYHGRDTVPLFILNQDARGECPASAPTLKWVPLWQYGEGKERNLKHARSTAVWPEATDEELCQEPEALKAALEARLPALIAEFKADMLAVGFVWPEWLEVKP